MIDIGLLRDETSRDMVKKNLARRGVKPETIDELVTIDEQWRKTSQASEAIAAQKKGAEQEIIQADPTTKATLIAAMKALGEEQKNLEATLSELQTKRETIWHLLPNLVFDDVPEGGEKDFTVIETVPETVPTPDFVQKDYLSLVPHLLDIERAGKVSGSRFVYIKGQLVRLELALISFLLDRLQPHGFMPVLPPVLIGEKAMAGMGYMDKGKDEIYQTQDNLFLVGTSEQAMGPMHMDEILAADSLPLRYVAFSPCFRREAGSHGKDVKGILRLHQFDKVEMFSFVSSDQSEAEHEFLLERQKDIMTALQLPYRVLKLAAGDLGAPSAKTYDIETWMPSEGKYRETHSTSNTTDYQARRLNVRIRDKEGNVTKAHMLNGTALAMSRIFIALIENHQRPDGTIAIPEALHPFLPADLTQLS